MIQTSEQTSDDAVFSLNSEVNTRTVVKYVPHGKRETDDHYVEQMQGTEQNKSWYGWDRRGVEQHLDCISFREISIQESI